MSCDTPLQIPAWNPFNQVTQTKCVSVLDTTGNPMNPIQYPIKLCVDGIHYFNDVELLAGINLLIAKEQKASLNSIGQICVEYYGGCEPTDIKTCNLPPIADIGITDNGDDTFTIDGGSPNDNGCPSGSMLQGWVIKNSSGIQIGNLGFGAAADPIGSNAFGITGTYANPIITAFLLPSDVFICSVVKTDCGLSTNEKCVYIAQVVFDPPCAAITAENQADGTVKITPGIPDAKGCPGGITGQGYLVQSLTFGTIIWQLGINSDPNQDINLPIPTPFAFGTYGAWYIDRTQMIEPLKICSYVRSGCGQSTNEACEIIQPLRKIQVLDCEGNSICLGSSFPYPFILEDSPTAINSDADLEAYIIANTSATVVQVNGCEICIEGWIGDPPVDLTLASGKLVNTEGDELKCLCPDGNIRYPFYTTDGSLITNESELLTYSGAVSIVGCKLCGALGDVEVCGPVINVDSICGDPLSFGMVRIPITAEACGQPLPDGYLIHLQDNVLGLDVKLIVGGQWADPSGYIDDIGGVWASIADHITVFGTGGIILQSTTNLFFDKLNWAVENEFTCEAAKEMVFTFEVMSPDGCLTSESSAVVIEKQSWMESASVYLGQQNNNVTLRSYDINWVLVASSITVDICHTGSALNNGDPLQANTNLVCGTMTNGDTLNGVPNPSDYHYRSGFYVHPLGSKRDVFASQIFAKANRSVYHRPYFSKTKDCKGLIDFSILPTNSTLSPTSTSCYTWNTQKVLPITVSVSLEIYQDAIISPNNDATYPRTVNITGGSLIHSFSGACEDTTIHSLPCGNYYVNIVSSLDDGTVLQEVFPLIIQTI